MSKGAENGYYPEQRDDEEQALQHDNRVYMPLTNSGDVSIRAGERLAATNGIFADKKLMLMSCDLRLDEDINLEHQNCELHNCRIWTNGWRIIGGMLKGCIIEA